MSYLANVYPFSNLQSLIHVASAIFLLWAILQAFLWMLGLLVEFIFLATFYGLCFNHQYFLHIILYNISISYRSFKPFKVFRLNNLQSPGK